MGSTWIDLKCSSQYVLTSLPPLTKQSSAATDGLVQARQRATQLVYVLAIDHQNTIPNSASFGLQNDTVSIKDGPSKPNESKHNLNLQFKTMVANNCNMIIVRY